MFVEIHQYSIFSSRTGYYQRLPSSHSYRFILNKHIQSHTCCLQEFSSTPDHQKEVQTGCNLSGSCMKALLIQQERFDLSFSRIQVYTLQFMNFWDIETFLAEDQLALFKFTQDAEEMAFLDPSKGIKGAVPAESPLHAPIWVVSTLRDYVFRNQTQLVKVSVPKYLQRAHNEGYLKALQNDRSANFETINLKQKSPYYYQIYESLHKPLEGNKNLIEPKLVKAMLVNRGSSIIEKASTHQQQGKAEAKFDNYTEFERNLFRSIRKKALEYQKWECKLEENGH